MKKQIALAIALAVAPFAASAGELNYSYVEGGFARTNIDVDGVGDADFDGAQLRGSAGINDSFYVFAGYGSTNNDDAGVDVDFNEGQIGLGYHFGLSDRVDLIAELGAIRQEIDSNAFGGAKADGGRASVGIRGELADNFEGWVKASYTDGGDFDGGFSGLVGAQLKFNATWGLVGEIEAGEASDDVDVTKYLIGLRASF